MIFMFEIAPILKIAEQMAARPSFLNVESYFCVCWKCWNPQIRVHNVVACFFLFRHDTLCFVAVTNRFALVVEKQ